MGLHSEQTGDSLKRHVGRKINQQKIEQQARREGFKFNILRFKKYYEMEITGNYLVSFP